MIMFLHTVPTVENDSQSKNCKAVFLRMSSLTNLQGQSLSVKIFQITTRTMHKMLLHNDSNCFKKRYRSPYYYATITLQ